jgi:GNAT superfamily N-acetyltransferase
VKLSKGLSSIHCVSACSIGTGKSDLARVITDCATIAYLGDIFVLKDYRGRGLAKWLMECVVTHPALQGLRRWILVTANAHDLYWKYGFTPLARPERFMERHDPDIYALNEA